MSNGYDKTKALSFIVPAFNEERHIGATLTCITELLRDRFAFEVIVVDNGSIDATATLARTHGAKVFVQHASTIGALRNLGASHAYGHFLIFLDADVHITQRWVDNLAARLALLTKAPRTLVGSICGVPSGASWIERSWFDPAQRNHRITHIGSGHLITTRAFFEELNGFSEVLRTGEDYDLSARAIAAGGEIVDAPELYVEHLGYPSTIGRFAKREMWHGEGDFVSWAAVIHSKVALTTLAYAVGHIAFVISLAAGRWILAAAFASLVIFLCLLSSFVKYRGRSSGSILMNAVLYYFYFAGRSGALLKALAGKASRRVAESSARTASRRTTSAD